MRELTALAARWEGFHYLPIIDEVDRDPDWPGRTGFVYEYFNDGTVANILGNNLDPSETSVFLCGNPFMVDSMIDMLGSLGFRRHTRSVPGTIFVEKYWADK